MQNIFFWKINYLIYFNDIFFGLKFAANRVYGPVGPQGLKWHRWSDLQINGIRLYKLEYICIGMFWNPQHVHTPQTR